jgi:signal transduction histidine kinase
MYSLKKSIARNLIINMILVMSGLLIILYFSMQQILQDYVLTRLQHDAESLISLIQQDENRKWRINDSHMSTVYNRVSSGHYYRVSVNDQVITSRSLFDTQFPVPDSPSGLSDSYIAKGPGHERWLIWVQQVNKKGHAIMVWIAEDIQPVQRQLFEYAGYAILLILLATTLLIFLQIRTLQQSFQVFESLRQNLSTIRLKKTEESGIAIPDEIMPLVHEIESLVDQLRNRIKRTRRAIGNLAHELKRPVQLLSIQQEDGVEQSLEPLEDIKNIINRELRRAKISGSHYAGGKFNPAEELPFMLQVMEKIYPHIQIKLDKGRLNEGLDLDRDDMLELTGNLLDNACKFAQHNVRLKLMKTSQHFVLIVEDDGQGLDFSHIDKIENRGVRLDETKKGHGLGLSICRDILVSYRGEMVFSQSSLGGLKVTVDIPTIYL